MKKKLIVIAVAIIAIGLIAYFGVGRNVVEKYSYGTEMADLNEFFDVTGEKLAIILQDTMVAEQAIGRDGQCYFTEATVDRYIGDGFYYDADYNGGTLMFTIANGTFEAAVGSNAYTFEGESSTLSYPICFVEGGTLYIAADYVSRFYAFTYSVYDLHVQLNTEWNEYSAMTVTGNTQIRKLGGIKSPILREVAKGETVELIEAMDEWSKVKTSDSYIGFIENKKMENAGVVSETAPNAVVLPDTDALSLEERVCLGFHAVASTAGNDTIYEMMKEASGINVIAPTWFSMIDDLGGIRNFSTTSYVQTAHSNGLEVWAVVDNFNYENETGNTVSDYAVLADTANRRTLENNIINAALEAGVDGVNLDFEGLSSDCGDHYAQFIKELSVLTHKHGLVFSIDNYVPFNYNEHYRIDVQGKFADYVLIMGYDEHYHGSGNPGSVASFNYVANGLDKTMEYVAPEKIINAIPFYTIVWKNSSGTITDSYLTLVNQKEFISNYNISYKWDETTCQNYAEWTSGGATYMVWFEDNDSITQKLNAMNSRNIGGVAVWRIGYGTSDAWNLISLYKTMGSQ